MKGPVPIQLEDVSFKPQRREALGVIGRNGSGKRRTADADRPGLVVAQASSLVTGEQPTLRLELGIMLESRSTHAPACLAVNIAEITGTARRALWRGSAHVFAGPGELTARAVSLPPGALW